ncbi:hypothetical protein CPT_Moabite_162 [Serratia phage Moabite]|uniref:Uncharacterized protein n=3 Tax=Moabitevirus TaxID=2843422 RepID=A0A7T3TLW5_9CAUD|nr:hypothetical protein HWB23_gp078 [Serratia phage vB_SmaM_ 2050HW]YP_009849256.1 hypothetical protein HWC48_gp254 [Serratia phage Moabite]QPX76662.1 hypothetical protein [Serratia phage vB_SmaM_Yaphecito]UCR74692.1 hypothetical protein [Serratia phage BUCT660]UGO54047.1 hypothetical protein HAYMO_65 [Serratia phage vB_SmaM_Haymo]UQT03556.1 hypothetical protein KODAMA_00890 [Serratia phage vB_SmaM-Kodama]URG14259.1 hypothetical protein [Pectobacterium phage vB_ParM-25]
MVRQEARFHMAMLLAQYSNRIANRFESSFEHRERVRSSNKAEMLEINEFWSGVLKNDSPEASRYCETLPVDRGIDVWLDSFNSKVLTYILRYW